MPPSDRFVHPTTYTEEYFLTECDGYADYLEGKENLARRLQALWRFLNVHPGMQVLDLGCGRGEIVVQCGLRGVLAVGIDYSDIGLRLAQQAVVRAESQAPGDWACPQLSLGNAKKLPFSEDAFDRVVMSDIVEHLYPDELETTLREVLRVLKPGGELLVHTMPNLWYYRYGYPLFRFVQRLQGTLLPADPRERFRFSHVHVNEQTPCALNEMLSRIGFSHWHVWLYDYRDYAEHGLLMRHSMRLLTGLPVVKRIFCDDVFAVARK